MEDIRAARRNSQFSIASSGISRIGPVDETVGLFQSDVSSLRTNLE
jgi:hypothetical protein